ncbi:MAG: GrpB family protein [Promicromonosporaceae bacterium]|nr:GrpB family protein [Promicromonosporaceae bacterium]
MAVEVVEYRDEWPASFAAVAKALRSACEGLPSVAVEHVGSTAVPGLAAKPILDIDVIVSADDLPAARQALEAIGYRSSGDLGMTDREAMTAPDNDPPRHVYLCLAGALAVRNHLAVRDTLRANPQLAVRYAAIKKSLAADPTIDIDAYLAGKSAILQEILEAGGITEAERTTILAVNNPTISA